MVPRMGTRGSIRLVGCAQLRLVVLSLLLCVVATDGKAQEVAVEQGDRVEVVLGPLRVRAGAGLVHDNLGSKTEGATGSVIDGSGQHVDGYWWWHIAWDDGLTGWSAQGDGTSDFFTVIREHVAQGSPEHAQSDEDGSDAEDSERADEAVPEAAAEATLHVGPYAAIAGAWIGWLEERSQRGTFVYPVTFSFDPQGASDDTIGEILYHEQEVQRSLCRLPEEDGVLTVVTSLDCATGERSVQHALILETHTTPHRTRAGDEYSAGTELLRVTGERTLDWGEVSWSGTLYRLGEGSEVHQMEAHQLEALRARDEDRIRGLQYAAAQELIAERRDEVLAMQARMPWAYDESTSCQMAPHPHMMVSQIAWSGDCIDGKAHGNGTVDYFDDDGLWLWRHEVSEMNGLTLVDGRLVVDVPPDAVTYDIPFTEYRSANCATSVGLTHRHVIISVNEDIDLTNDLIARQIMETGTLIARATCSPELEFRDIRTYVFWGEPAGEDVRRNATSGITVRNELMSSRTDRSDALGFTVRHSREHRNLVSWLTERREVALAQHREQQARAREAQRAAAERQEVQRRVGLVVEINNLKTDYYDLRVALHPGRVDVRATIPPTFPEPTAPGMLTLECEHGEWSSQDLVWLERFGRASGVELSPRRLTVRDVSVSCTEAGKIMLEAASFQRTLGLLTHRPVDDPEGQRLTQFDDRYVSLAFPHSPESARGHAVPSVVWTTDLVGAVSVGNPSWWAADAVGLLRTEPFNEVILWNGGAVTTRENFRGVVAVKIGGTSDLRPVMFEGETTVQHYDRARELTIFVQSAARSVWDYLELEPSQGRLTWWQSPEAPR